MTAPDTLPPELAELGRLPARGPAAARPAWARSLDARAAAGLPAGRRAAVVARSRAGRARSRPSLLPAWRCRVRASPIVVAIALGSRRAASDGELVAAAAARRRRTAPRAELAGAARRPAIAAPVAERREPGLGRHVTRPPRRSAAPRSRSPPRPRDIERRREPAIVRRHRRAPAASSPPRRSATARGGGRSSCGSRRHGCRQALAELSRLAHVRERSQATQRHHRRGRVGARPPARRPQRSARAAARARHAPPRSTRPSDHARLRIVNASLAAARGACGAWTTAPLRQRLGHARRRPTARSSRRRRRAGRPADALRDAGACSRSRPGVAADRARRRCSRSAARRARLLAGRASTRRRRERALERSEPRSGSHAARAVVSLPTMAASTQDTAALLGRVPVFEELRGDDLARVADVAVPRRFARRRGRLPRGRRLRHVLRRPHRPRARGPRARRRPPDHARHFGPGDIFGELAMFDDERRSATVEAIDDLEVLAILGADMRALIAAPTPQIAVKLAIALGRRLRAPTSGSRASRSRPCRAASPRCSPSSSSRRAPRARAERDVRSPPRRPSWRKLAGSSRESASRFLAVLERAGVISQGRGRLTVHDPAALPAMSTDRLLLQPEPARPPTAASSCAATTCS